VDLELPLDDATDELEKLLRHMEPCGIGNPGPVFSARGVSIIGGPDRIGADGVKMRLATSRGAMDAVGWGMAHRVSELAAARGGTIEIAYKLDRNEYRNTSVLQAQIIDFRTA
jgi:single-stranded-DNA-specific exonuclease